jgi:hypothetical protein
MNIRLAKKNKDVVPSSWERLYGSIVSAEFRKRYSAEACEAIINNYLDDPSNVKYVSEFKEMQEYRKQCKIIAKTIMGI